MEAKKHEGYGEIILPEVVDLTNASEFKQALQSLYDQGYNTINVNCMNLQMIDGTGLGRLVLIQKKLKERGGELKLINVTNDYVKYFFDIIDIQRYISIEINLKEGA